VPGGAGRGITVYRISARTGRWTLLQVVRTDNRNPGPPPTPELPPANPSYLTLDHTGRFLYAVHGDTTYLSSYAVDPTTGTLTFINIINTGRQNPVYITPDPGNRFVVVANLDVPGSVITLPIRSDGSLGPIARDIRLPGTPGPHRSQQLGSMPHQARFDPTGRWLLVADRGQDRIFILTMNPDTGALTLNDPGWVQLREIEGPRHMAFHPSRRFVTSVDELRSTVTTFTWDDTKGVLEQVQVLPSQPSSMTGDTRAAEITVAPSGRFVYASNRSGAGVIDPQHPQDTIGIWRVDPKTGILSDAGAVSTQGYVPRFFTFNTNGTRMYVANQATNTIMTFAVDTHSGALTPTGPTVTEGSPVCIVLTQQP
jgi:6-phosphogluconolactonase (cycloisomerase 2 family)